MSSVITGWGKAVPERVVTNLDMEKIVDTSDEWIVSRTGIRARHFASGDETAATLAAAAGRIALERAGLNATDLDLIIVATVTGDYTFPATANMIQSALGAKCPSFDIQAACTGWIYGMVTAHQFLTAGTMKHILVVGVDVISKILNFKDRTTCVLFGDGAGAAVLSASNDEGGILGWTLGSDGDGVEKLYRPAGGSRTPLTRDNIDSSEAYITMNGSEVFKFATRIMGTAMEEALVNAKLSIGDIDLFIPHQANMRIIDAATRRLGLPPEKVFVNLQEYGNTSAGAIPIALCEAVEQGRVTPGSNLGMVAFGAGLTWAAIALKWTAAL